MLWFYIVGCIYVQDKLNKDTSGEKHTINNSEDSIYVYVEYILSVDEVHK